MTATPGPTRPDGHAHDHGHDGHDHDHANCGHDHGPAKPQPLAAPGAAATAGLPNLGALTPAATTGATPTPTPAPAPAAPAAHAHDHAGHDHGHDHAHDDGDDDGHGHGHHHHHHDGPPPKGWWLRLTVAGILLLAVLLVATLVSVRAGTAVVITRFGAPVRVLVDPGLAFKAPPPVEQTIDVDTRLYSTSSGYHTLTTKDALSVELQAYIFWRVRGDHDSVLQFVRALGNRPDDASDQLRTFLGSSLQTVTGRYALADLLNADQKQVRLAQFESDLRDSLAQQMRDTYGIEVVQVGIERLMLPQTTVQATVARMASERATAAEQKKAEGSARAAEIRSAASLQGKITLAKATEDASRTEAAARTQAAEIYGRANSADPQLYVFLRSLDALDQAISPSTRLILRTDAAPFRVLIDGPPTSGATAPAPAAAPDIPALPPATLPATVAAPAAGAP